VFTPKREGDQSIQSRELSGARLAHMAPVMTKGIRSTPCVILLALSGGGCDGDPGLARVRSEIVFEPASLAFGDVAIGQSRERLLKMVNDGSDVLDVCLAEGPRCPAATVFMDRQFSWIIDEPEADRLTIGPGAELEVLVRFTPSVDGATAGVLAVAHDGTNGPMSEVSLTGNGVAPDVLINPAAIDFGMVTVGQRRDEPIEIINHTALPQRLSIDAITQDAAVFGVTNADGADVAPTESTDFELAAGASVTVRAFYAPVEEGADTASLVVRFCPACERTVALAGHSARPIMTITPASLDFGSLPEAQSATREFEIGNQGNAPLTVSALNLDAGTSAEFSPQASLPLEIAVGEVATVAVEYVGVTPGRDEGRIAVVSNSWDDPNTADDERIGYVAVTAESTGPDIEPLPAGIAFGTVPLETTIERRLLLENVGNRPLAISSIELMSANRTLTMRVRDRVPASLAPGDTVEATLTFTPLTPGPVEGQVVVTSDDRDEGTLVVPVSGIGGIPDGCAVGVAPTEVTFGIVERGTRATLGVEIRNPGNQACSLSNFMVTGSADFALGSGAPAALTVPPQSQGHVQITFTPAAYGQMSAQLTFATNAADQPTVSVPLSGASAASDVRVIPSSLNFGVVPVRCRSPYRNVTIYNTGNNDVQITSAALDPTTTAEFTLDPLSTPRTLRGGESAQLRLRYAPTDIGLDTGVLFIEHTAAPAPVAVPLTGDGRTDAVITDSFQQLASPAADVLFVVDNSGSMQDEQNALGSNLSAFLSFAQAEGVDYRIAVTTTDVARRGERGRFVEGQPYQTRVMSPSTPNVTRVFSANVNVGTDGDGSERGFEAAYLALTDPLINTWNTGLLRPDAMLAVIFVSDEQEQSSRPVSFYESFLRNVKGFARPEMFSASAIVGTTPGGCRSRTGEADYAPRYMQMAQNTGGVVESICNANWGQTLANIGLNSFGLKRTFFLSSQPVQATLAVRVDGIQVPTISAAGVTSWSYDVGSNSVVFVAGRAPQPGATVEVTYSVACL